MNLPRVVRWPAKAVTWTAAKSADRTRKSKRWSTWLFSAALGVAAILAVAVAAVAAAPAIGLVEAAVWVARRERAPEASTRARSREPRTRRWPQARQVAATVVQRMADHLSPQTGLPPGVPQPVGIFAGRYQGYLHWREDLDTFALDLLLGTDEQGEPQFLRFGTNPAEHPTVERLAGELASRDLALDPVSLDLARSYQLAVWDTSGPCTFTASQQADGSNRLTLTTPSNRTYPIEPAAERDSRSAAFGPPVVPAWGTPGPRALETARLVLEYTHGKTRTPQQLFDNARAFTLTDIAHWPLNLSFTVADIQEATNTGRALSYRELPLPAQATAAPAATGAEEPVRPLKRRPQQAATTTARRHAPPHRQPATATR